MEEVRDCRLEEGLRVEGLVECYRDIHGFMAGHLAEAIEVLREGLEASSVRVLTFTGNLVATGLRGVLAQLIDGGLFNVVFTTAGALDHDIARFMGGKYLKGRFEADDTELHRRGVHRLGNIFIPVESYGPLVERFVRTLAERAAGVRGEWGVYELLRLAGSLMEGDRDSILAAAARRGVDVFVPGWPDGAFGTSLFMERQRGTRITVDYFRDMARLADIFFPQEGEAAALIVGGGISKHHAIWWSQFRGGLDYAVYVTTAVEYDGSLSGAHPREAVSWGKIKESSRRVVVYGDATITLPVIAYCLLHGCG
ncbi:probable deoxyhypusine synthase [Aeropyrum pernix]|uniref:Probable deoxyhypusine synthase n=1 Tax=Aeropyrum pernix TaxID=56636 RepID=A0A401H7M8_AERPX|nr:deoxyhypusine synthase [Aeropyrum pernix]GBF08413.1 probable deoxyhypusine synthase [Aeropyrum pernix]